MNEPKSDMNVYGHNLPVERGRTRPGIREDSIAAKSGDDQASTHETDKDEAEIQDSQNHTISDRPPKPPRHAPLSDDEPS